jgi:hypothetical protein
MFRLFTCITIVVIFFGGCTNTIGTWENDQIDPRKRETIKELNTKLLKAIAANDVDAVNEFLSDTLRKAPRNTIPDIVSTMAPRIDTVKFYTLEEFNGVSIKAHAPVNLYGRGVAENAYDISLIALNREIYLSVLVVESKEGNVMALIAWGKYAKGYKINILRFGNYQLYGHTGPEYLAMAEVDHGTGNLINAMMNVSLASQLMEPAGSIFNYECKDKVKGIYDKIMDDTKAAYQLPITINNIGSKPRIFSIKTEIANEGYFPRITYLSTIRLKDTTALRWEYESLRKEMPDTFKGINTGKRWVIYDVVNRVSEDDDSVPTYRFIDKRLDEEAAEE